MPADYVKTICSKCESRDSTHWEKDEDDNVLCEHCNEDLIARNLAKEIMQHEIVKRDIPRGETTTSESEREYEDEEEVEEMGEEEEVYGDDEGVGEEEEVDEEEEGEGEGEGDGDGEEDDDDEEEDEEDEEDEEEIEEEEEEEDEEEEMQKAPEEEEPDEEDEEDGPVVRRSARSTLNRYKNPDLEPPEPQEISRRAKAYSKRNVYKSPSAQATCVTSPYVFHRGVYYQLGDIVAIVDCYGRGIFYAQITSFLTDQYCNRSATIQWLLPTAQSPDNNVAFDPRTYYLGYMEDFPRSLDCMVPIMHAPSDYYKFNDSPYPPVTPPPEIAKYVWHNFERVYIKKIG